MSPCTRHKREDQFWMSFTQSSIGILIDFKTAAYQSGSRVKISYFFSFSRSIYLLSFLFLPVEPIKSMCKSRRLCVKGKTSM